MSAVRGRRLTAAELRVACQVATGASNAQVATALFVTVWTVKSHLQNINAKLGTRNRTEVAVWYRRHEALAPIRDLIDAAPNRPDCRYVVPGHGRRVLVDVEELRRAVLEAEAS